MGNGGSDHAILLMKKQKGPKDGRKFCLEHPFWGQKRAFKVGKAAGSGVPTVFSTAKAGMPPAAMPQTCCLDASE